jgi:uracil-DNA glycosylase family 4
MTQDINIEFLDILAQVRTHLEFQKALGVTHIEVPPGRATVPAAPAPGIMIPAKKEPAVVADRHPSAAVRSEPAPPQGLDAVRQDVAACVQCRLGRGRRTIVFGEGSPRADVLFVGGAPGAEEEKQSRPFADAAGQLLTDIIVKGMQLRREDLYITTAVKCTPPEGSGPGPGELEACAAFLARQIDAVKPKIIVALGGVAAHALLGKGQDIASLRGTWHRYRGIPVMPTLEPAQLLANPHDKKAVWEDIKKVIAELGKIKGRA